MQNVRDRLICEGAVQWKNCLAALSALNASQDAAPAPRSFYNSEQPGGPCPRYRISGLTRRNKSFERTNKVQQPALARAANEFKASACTSTTSLRPLPPM